MIVYNCIVKSGLIFASSNIKADDSKCESHEKKKLLLIIVIIIAGKHKHNHNK